MIKHIKYIEKNIKENEVFLKKNLKKKEKDYGKEVSNILMIERPFV